MKDLMFWGMIVISSLVIGMSIYILIVQAYLNKAMIDKFNEQKRELKRAFGWEEYNWAENFGDFTRKVDKLIEFKKEIEQLEVIQKAIEVQRLSDLIGKKEQIEWEIKKLEEK
uniref:Uncharacterized protein n=1 Tax=Siphoviridae sp. ctwQY3 TaxID=2826515 RepID=A0A8S5LU77_9CAUD|nr:MAG TPA: hypothetical protein [Siphoviridae sp. ctwQY3]